MILFIGDSLAVGTPLSQYTAEKVVKRAEVGIGSADAERRFLHPISGARVLVVSLGTNDFWRPSAVAPVARKIKRTCRAHSVKLLWIEVDSVDNAGAINKSIRALDIKMVPWSSGPIHPDAAGYARRAKLIAAAIDKHFPR